MRTRLIVHGLLLASSGALFLFGDWGPALSVALYMVGMLWLLPALTGDPANFPDRGQLSEIIESLRDSPDDSGPARADLITRTLRGFESLFHTRVYFLEASQQPRLFQSIGSNESDPSLIAARLRAAPRRYREFARSLADEGTFVSGRGTPRRYRPRGVHGDYFLPLIIQNEITGVICLVRSRNFSRRQRSLLKSTAAAIALLLRTADLREQMKTGQEGLRRNEKNLTRMEGMTRSLLNHITREIARPIDDIENNAQRLSTSGADTGTSTLRIQKLHLLAHQVSALLEDSLLLVELESGTYRLTLEECDIHEILKEAIMEARMKLPDSRINIEIDYPPGLPVRVDRYLLSSVIYRLFRTIRLIPRRGTLNIFQESSTPPRMVVSLDLVDEGGQARMHHLSQLYPYLQTFTKTMNKSIRLMGSRLEFPGGLDRILSIRFPVPAPVGAGEVDEGVHDP